MKRTREAGSTAAVQAAVDAVLNSPTVKKSPDMPGTVRKNPATAGSLATVFFLELPVWLVRRGQRKIEQLTSIVTETEQSLNGGNSPLESRAQISDGLHARCSNVHRKYLCRNSNALPCLRTTEVGVGVWTIVEGAGEK